MRFDNRPADGQSHSDTLGLGGKEWLENTLRSLGIEPFSRILDLDKDLMVVPG
jgi:hypothetical protein